MSFEVRAATIHDRATLEVFAPLVHEIAEEHTLEILLQNANMLLAVRGDQVLGLVARDPSFFGQDFIPKLFVLPEHRKQGIAWALMTEMARSCRTPKIFSSTNLSNAPMFELFRKLGWTYAGTVDHIDPSDPEVFFVKYKEAAHG